MTFHGLCGRLKVVCSLGGGCACSSWTDGNMVWESDSVGKLVVSEDGKERFEYMLNIKYAISMAMSPGTKAAGHTLLTGMQFRPRSDNVHNAIIKSIVFPYIIERKKEIEAEYMKKLKGETHVASLDNCWNHARNAEGATTSVAIGGKIICTITDKEDAEAKLAVAASKEPLLFRIALKRIINGEGIDVAAVCIDPNATNAKI